MLGEILDDLLISASTGRCITASRHFPARAAVLAPFPASLDPRIAEALRARGIEQLYSHQARVWELVEQGKNVVVVTPTASGKTLCYNLPALQSLVERPEARILYLFPTKALAQDQLSELENLAKSMPEMRMFTYDGDTPRMRGAPCGRAPISSSPTPTCCTPASCRTTPSGRASSRISASSSSTSSTPTAACSARTWPTCCAGSSASAPTTAPRRSSSWPRRRSAIRASWRIGSSASRWKRSPRAARPPARRRFSATTPRWSTPSWGSGRRISGRRRSSRSACCATRCRRSSSPRAGSRPRCC